MSGGDDGLLPPGRQLAITWSIPDGFGGMTAAMLRRSAGFARLADAEVDVLTFDGRPDYPEVRARLAERGEPADGVRVRNLYERLRTEPMTPGPVALEPELGRARGGRGGAGRPRRPGPARRGGRRRGPPRAARSRRRRADRAPPRRRHARGARRARTHGPDRVGLITTFDAAAVPSVSGRRHAPATPT